MSTYTESTIATDFYNSIEMPVDSLPSSYTHEVVGDKTFIKTITVVYAGQTTAIPSKRVSPVTYVVTFENDGIAITSDSGWVPNDPS